MGYEGDGNVPFLNPNDIRLESVKKSRQAQGKAFLDVMNRGDVQRLYMSGRMLIFISGVPRAYYERRMGMVLVSEEVQRMETHSRKWYLEMVSLAAPKGLQMKFVPQEQVEMSTVIVGVAGLSL